MADTIKLATNDFKLLPAGEEVALTITKAEAKPKANPSIVEVTFAHASGVTQTKKYDLKVNGALIGFSILARCILGNDVDDFSIKNDLPKFINKTIECEVTHTNPKDSEKGYVYANISKTKRVIELEASEVEEEDDDL